MNILVLLYKQWCRQTKNRNFLREIHFQATTMHEMGLTYLFQEKYNFSSVIGIVSNTQSGVAQKIYRSIPE